MLLPRENGTYRFPNEIGLKAGIVGIGIAIEGGRVGGRNGGRQGRRRRNTHVNGPIGQVSIIGLGRLRHGDTGQARNGIFVFAQRIHTAPIQHKGIFPLQDGRGTQAFITGGHHHLSVRVVRGSRRFIIGIVVVRVIVESPLSPGRHDQISIVMMMDRFASIGNHHHDRFARPPNGIVLGRGNHFDTGRIQRLRMMMMERIRVMFQNVIPRGGKGRSFGAFDRKGGIGRIGRGSAGCPQGTARDSQKTTNGQFGTTAKMKSHGTTNQLAATGGVWCCRRMDWILLRVVLLEQFHSAAATRGIRH